MKEMGRQTKYKIRLKFNHRKEFKTNLISWDNLQKKNQKIIWRNLSETKEMEFNVIEKKTEDQYKIVRET